MTGEALSLGNAKTGPSEVSKRIQRASFHVFVVFLYSLLKVQETCLNIQKALSQNGNVHPSNSHLTSLPGGRSCSDQTLQPRDSPANPTRFWILPCGNHLPSGKHTKNYEKSPFLMGQSTISMAIFNSKLFVYQRVIGNRQVFPMVVDLPCGQVFCRWSTSTVLRV